MGKAKAPNPALRKPIKPAKIKLSKEQKLRVSQIIRMENRISVCREYISLWSQLFDLFAEDIHSRTIAEQEEKVFFKTVTELARKHFLFCELMSDAFEAPDKILDVLLQCSSLSNIKGMNESTLSKLELDWHTLFLDMNVALGRLLRRLPVGTNIDEALARAEAVAQAQQQPGAVPLPPSPDGAGKKPGFFARLFGKKARGER